LYFVHLTKPKKMTLNMTPTPVRCLILACGNTLRGDDGVGPWLAEWAENRFRSEPAIRIISRHQLTPEFAEEIAASASVILIDCSTASAPGSVSAVPVEPVVSSVALNPHHIGPAELLALARDLYSSSPREALLLTIGAASTELSEHPSDTVRSALPEACRLLEEAVRRLLQD
jgi:hydrogenase maturation protease